MIIYHGSINKFSQFTKETVVQNLNNHIDTIGFWFTSDIDSAKPFAMGTKTVIQKSETEFWDDGTPKVVQFNRPIKGFIYKVYIDDPYLKEYKSNSEDSYKLFMKERDQYCDYFSSRNETPTWKDQAILLNKEAANAEFRKNLMNKQYEGIVIRKTELMNQIADLYCIFSGDSLHIADIIPVDDIGYTLLEIR